jgi:predicted hydrocarbon binding protein
MTTSSSLTHLAYRSCIDAIEDVLGENGKNSVLRFAGLEELIKNPIDYNPDERVPYEYVSRLFIGVRDLLGDRGYEAVMYRGGTFAVRNVVKHSEPLQNLIAMDYDPVEKLKLGYQAYVRNAGYDPDKTLEYLAEERQIVNHRPDCTECDELVNQTGGEGKLTKPSCAFVRGLLKGVGDCFERELSVEVVEEKCRLVGDPQCQYRITYQLKKE